jgi:hypothetical protein
MSRLNRRAALQLLFATASVSGATTFFLFSFDWQLQNNAENFDHDQYRQRITAASTEADLWQVYERSTWLA